ncbi:MAG: hypothetical protein ACXWB6_07080, partial [Kaistella sp.]
LGTLKTSRPATISRAMIKTTNEQRTKPGTGRVLSIGMQRLSAIMTEMGVQFGFILKDVDHSDTPMVIKSLSNSINLPKPDEVWDGRLNSFLFKKCLQNTSISDKDNLLLDFFHYHQLLDSFQFGPSDSRIAWPKYWRIRETIHILAIVIQEAVKNRTKSLSKEITPFHKVIHVSKLKLAGLLSFATDINVVDCLNSLDALTFNPSYRHLEIWDNPLIASGNNNLLIVPSIILNGSPFRLAENLIAQWDEDLFSKRGKLLELEIRSILTENNIPSQGPVLFIDKNQEQVECDVVAYWDNSLILIEAKCTKSTYDPADFYFVRKKIEEAIRQLNIRRDKILENWYAFKEAAPSLGLPVDSLPKSQIYMIAVTNVLGFTTWSKDDVIVTDEFCLQRFFGSEKIEALLNNSVIETVGKIRESEIPNANELFAYLKSPPQVELIKQRLSIEPFLFPLIKDSDPKIGYAQAVYKVKNSPGFPNYAKLNKHDKGRKKHPKKTR